MTSSSSVQFIGVERGGPRKLPRTRLCSFKNCFDTAPGSVAHRWVQESWARNGISPTDRSTCPNDKIHMPATETVQVKDFSPYAHAAICELSGGEERVKENTTWGNFFIANYGFGRDKEWVAPSPEAGGWHVDGDMFLHFLDSADQGLLVVVLFSDIHPKGGGTFIACDSVEIVTHFLAARPEGVPPFDFPKKEKALIHQCKDCRETTGQAGDVFLLHPFTLHTSSYNHRPEARFMINPVVEFREPMRFDRRSDGSVYSPVELAVLRALKVDHYDFKPTSPRQRLVPPRIAQQQALLAKEQERLAALKA